MEGSPVLGDIVFWRTAGIIVAAVGQTLFTLLYCTFPWWRNFLGRALFFKAFAFTILVDVAVAGRIWEWPHEDAHFVILYWVLGAGIWYQFSAFLRVRLDGKQDRVSGNPKAQAREREAERDENHHREMQSRH